MIFVINVIKLKPLLHTTHAEQIVHDMLCCGYINTHMR